MSPSRLPLRYYFEIYTSPKMRYPESEVMINVLRL